MVLTKNKRLHPETILAVPTPLLVSLYKLKTKYRLPTNIPIKILIYLY